MLNAIDYIQTGVIIANCNLSLVKYIKKKKSLLIAFKKGDSMKKRIILAVLLILSTPFLSALTILNNSAWPFQVALRGQAEVKAVIANLPPKDKAYLELKSPISDPSVMLEVLVAPYTRYRFKFAPAQIPPLLLKNADTLEISESVTPIITRGATGIIIEGEYTTTF